MALWCPLWAGGGVGGGGSLMTPGWLPIGAGHMEGAGGAGPACLDPQDLAGPPLRGRARGRPGTGEWAIIEGVGPLADTEERALGRVRRMVAEDDPELAPFDQEALAEERHYLGLDLN